MTLNKFKAFSFPECYAASVGSRFPTVRDSLFFPFQRSSRPKSVLNSRMRDCVVNGGVVWLPGKVKNPNALLKRDVATWKWD